jgi:hypothetical protein
MFVREERFGQQEEPIKNAVFLALLSPTVP